MAGYTYPYPIPALANPAASGEAIVAGQQITARETALAEIDVKLFTGTADFARAKARKLTIEHAAVVAMGGPVTVAPPWFAPAFALAMGPLLAPLEARIAPIEAAVAPLAPEIAPLVVRNAPMEGAVAPLAPAIVALQGRMAPIEAAVAPVEAAVQAVGRHIAPMEASVASLSAAIAQMDVRSQNDQLRRRNARAEQYALLLRETAGAAFNTRPAFLSDPPDIPNRIFPGNREELMSMSSDQVTDFAVWYGLDGVEIPTANATDLPLRRTAILLWISNA